MGKNGKGKSIARAAAQGGRSEGVGKKGTASSWTNSSREGTRNDRVPFSSFHQASQRRPPIRGPVFDEFVCTFTRGRLYVPRQNVRTNTSGAGMRQPARPDVAGTSTHCCQRDKTNRRNNRGPRPAGYACTIATPAKPDTHHAFDALRTAFKKRAIRS